MVHKGAKSCAEVPDLKSKLPLDAVRKLGGDGKSFHWLPDRSLIEAA